MKSRIALIGSDVSGSLSPAMHNAAFSYLNLPFSYHAVSMSEAEFEALFSGLAHRAYTGFNITIPYKETAIRFLDAVSSVAERLKAVNTILLRNGASFGENTDVTGLLTALEESGHRPKPSEIVFIFGAGGAAKASIEVFSSLGVRQFVAITRDAQRLEHFILWFKNHYPEHNLEAFSLLSTSQATFMNHVARSAYFVNAAPLEAYKQIPYFSNISFPGRTVCVEWTYRPTVTPWVKKTREFVSGYKILLYQGMQAFKLWTNQEAPEEVMEKALLKELS